MTLLRPRPASASDGRAIGRISFRSHTLSYRGFAPASFVDAQVESEHVAWWSARVADPPPGHRSFVVERGGDVVGFSLVGPLEDGYEFAGRVRPLADDGPVAVLYSIHVDPDHLGCGAGTALMRASLEGLRSAGFPVVVLDTHEANDRARRFYEAGGWQAFTTALARGGESMVLYRLGLPCGG